MVNNDEHVLEVDDTELEDEFNEDSEYVVDDVIGYLQTQEKYLKGCFKSMMYTFYDIFSEIHCGYIDKIYFKNTEKVFTYNYEKDLFESSDLVYNQEEEYIIMILSDYDIENQIPFFNYIHYNTTNGNVKTLNKFIREKLYLKNKYNKMKEKYNNERKRPNQETKQD